MRLTGSLHTNKEFIKSILGKDLDIDAYSISILKDIFAYVVFELEWKALDNEEVKRLEELSRQYNTRIFDPRYKDTAKIWAILANERYIKYLESLDNIKHT